MERLKFMTDGDLNRVHFMADIKLYKIINDLSKKYNLKNEEKILLGTDGSITNILEILFNREVVVKTISQKIINETNHREVILKIEDKPLIYAISKIPLRNIEDKGLRENIKRDLLSADIPIGKILKMHNLETRREIIDISYKEPPIEVKEYLKIEDNIKLPMRTYKIIFKKNTLMIITEIFNVSKYL